MLSLGPGELSVIGHGDGLAAGGSTRVASRITFHPVGVPEKLKEIAFIDQLLEALHSHPGARRLDSRIGIVFRGTYVFLAQRPRNIVSAHTTRSLGSAL